MPIPVLVTSTILKYLPHALLYVILAGLTYYAYTHVYKEGAKSVQIEWDSEKAKQAILISELKAKYAQLESKHIKETERIKYELNQANKDHEIALSGIRADFASRLQAASKRASNYQRLAQAGTTECGSLASYTTELDRSLEQGRSLVREFRETLRFRDSQLVLVGSQLMNDRALLNKAEKDD